ncbi:MAG: preprotein translocase subunit SecE [Armatimonadetes bacterium]|nr:preprotein translocase subunit SecE [Armatimonadota bacterium]
MANGTNKKEGTFQRVGRFLREVWLELKKTTWPTYDELKKSTAIVIAAVAIVTLWVGGLDYLLSVITRRFGW